MTPVGESLLPAPWEIDAELRRTGLGAPPPRPEDMRRCWVRACLLWDAGELRAIRQAMQDMWDALPDARHRRCGNGQALEAFLGATRCLEAAADPQDEAAALLDVRWPQPRPAA